MARRRQRRRLVFKIDNGYLWVKQKFSRLFFRFGVMVGRHPIVFSLVTLVVSLGMGSGIFVLKENTDTEKLFTPMGSQIFTDRKRIKELFPDSTSWNFDAFGLNDVPSMAVLLFRQGGTDTTTTDKYFPAEIDTDQEKNNILDPTPLKQIQNIMGKVKNITVKYNDKVYTVEDLCARHAKRCVVDGEYYTTDVFAGEVESDMVTFPNSILQGSPRQLDLNLAGVSVTPEKKLKAARVMKIRFYWRVDRFEVAKEWNKKFLEVVSDAEKDLSGGLNMAFSTSESLERELLEGTSGDALYFGLTLFLMVIYSVIVSTGGDVVSTRALLACGGVLAAVLGIVSSLGFLSYLGVEYVNFVGIMPFLVMGIGVDDMFLLMSSWGESIERDVDVPQRVGMTFSKAGIGITITTLTDFLAFLIGVNSTFVAVRQFCLFTAIAVLLCYVWNCTLFGACLRLHGDRVYSGKHCLTCQKIKTREQLREENANACKVYCCGGSVPKKKFEDESKCEQLPRYILPRLLLNPVIKVLVLLAFMGYVGAAVYGAIQLKPGMKYVDLVLRSSYYYKYSSWDEKYFGQRLAIAYVVDQDIDYAGKEGDFFRKLLLEGQNDPVMDPDFIRCWLHQYSRSVYYPLNAAKAANKTTFIEGLKDYLQNDILSLNDIKFDNDKNPKTIVASRCYLLSKNEVSIFIQAELMIRMRDLVEKSKDFKMFVFQPVFVMLEHTIAILPSTLQTIGTAVAAMFVVTLVMLPQLLVVSLVTLNIIFIITCVFGFMYYLDISFSGISMIHILMSIGFSVDFSAHICAAYLMSDRPLRQDRARYALVHASGPIFNGGMSSLVGVSMLLFSESYFFRTFFKIMSMVITAGAINSVFFMPIVLSYIGPESPEAPKQPRRSVVAKLAAINERERQQSEGAGDQNVSASCDCRYASGPSLALSGTDAGPRQALALPETSVASYRDDHVPPYEVPPHQNVSASCDCRYASSPRQALSGPDPGPRQALTLPETSVAGYSDGHVPHPDVDAVDLLPNSRARSLVDPEGLGSTLKKPASPSSEAGSVAVLSACFPTSIVYHAVSVAPPPAAAAAAASLTDGEEVDENHNSQETAGAQRCGRSCLKWDEPPGAKDPGVPLTGALPQGVGTDAAETGGENSIPTRGVTTADVLASGDSDAEYGDVGASVQGHSTVSDHGALLRQHSTDNDDGALLRQHSTDNDDGALLRQHSTDNDDGAHSRAPSRQHSTDNDDGAPPRQHSTDNDDGAPLRQHSTDNDDGAPSRHHSKDSDDGAPSRQHQRTGAR